MPEDKKAEEVKDESIAVGIVDDGASEQDAADVKAAKDYIDNMTVGEKKKKTVEEETVKEEKDEAAEVVSDEKEEKSTEVEDDSKKESDDKKTDGDDNPISEELVERAIRAGMKLSEINKIRDEDTISHVCEMLESKSSSGDADDKQDASDETQDDAGDIDFDAITLDPEEYDEGLVSAFDAMKDLIKKQSAKIGELTKTNDSGWFDSKVDSLNVDVEAGKRETLQKKFNVLEGGYRSAGEQVSRDDVFKEAASLVLADELKAASEKSDKADLASRDKLKVNRPTNHNQSKKSDPIKEWADEIDRKFFKN